MVYTWQSATILLLYTQLQVVTCYCCSIIPFSTEFSWGTMLHKDLMYWLTLFHCVKLPLSALKFQFADLGYDGTLFCASL